MKTSAWRNVPVLHGSVSIRGDEHVARAWWLRDRAEAECSSWQCMSCYVQIIVQATCLGVKYTHGTVATPSCEKRPIRWELTDKHLRRVIADVEVGTIFFLERWRDEAEVEVLCTEERASLLLDATGNFIDEAAEQVICLRGRHNRGVHSSATEAGAGALRRRRPLDSPLGAIAEFPSTWRLESWGSRRPWWGTFLWRIGCWTWESAFTVLNHVKEYLPSPV